MDIQPIVEAREEVKEPAALVLRAASLLQPGRALDLACGRGRHAIWLHDHGWNVTAVDRDQEAIASVRAKCPEIDARVVDLEQMPFAFEPFSADGHEWDLIVCWLYFQRDLYPAIRTAVRPGGVVALSVALQGRFAANAGELRGYFPQWTILHDAEVMHGRAKRANELLAMK